MNTLPLPPTPSLSRFKQTRGFTGRPYELMAACRRECGPIFRLDLLGMGTWVLVCDPPTLIALHKMPEEKVVAGKIHFKVLGDKLSPFASFSIDGPEFMRRRKRIVPHLNGRRIWSHADTIRRVVLAELDQWPRGETFAFAHRAFALSVDLIARVVFSAADDDVLQRIEERVDRFMGSFHAPGIMNPMLQFELGGLTPWGRFVRARRVFWDLIVELAEERLASGPLPDKADDIFTELLLLHKEDPESFPLEHLAHEVSSLFVGGAESTAKTLLWTFLGLLEQPHTVERLRAELDDVLGGAPITVDTIGKLPYLDAVINEGMRYRPVGPFAGLRLTAADIELGGFKIPARTVIAQCLSEAGRLEEVFPVPDRFDPDSNFLGRRLSPREWLPFGGGIRMCFGKGLAIAEMAITVAETFRNFELELVPGDHRPKRDGIGFGPADGLRIVARERAAIQSADAAA
ncbi:MAG: cytochrome P450 [Acidobacteriota bacterium]